MLKRITRHKKFRRVLGTTLALAILAGFAPIAEWSQKGNAPELFAKNGDNLDLLAWPNPFSTDTQVLKIALSDKSDFAARAKVTIYNLAGKKVYSGSYRGRITWSGFDSSGNRMAPGVYYVKMLFKHDDGGVSTQWYTVAIR